MATPLTTVEMGKMDRSAKATWPRGVILLCNCGKVGPPTVVEGHRGRSGNLLCRKQPEAFLTVEEAQERAVKVESARIEAERNRLPTLLDQAMQEQAEAHAEPSGQPDRPKSGPGSRGGKPAARGDGRTPTPSRVETLGPATVRLTIEMEAEAFRRYDRVRRDPQFGFEGDPGDYLNRCEEALWTVIDWIAAGCQGPISIRLAA